MTLPFIAFSEGDRLLDWIGLTDALAAGHALPKAEIGDTFLYRGGDTLLNRSAFIDGLGIAVKAATIYPGNAAAGKPVVNGAVTLFSDEDGTPEALIDFHLVTKWKTVADSLLAARRLARPDSRRILIVGAGTVGRNLHAAYSTLFPDAAFSVWNRTRARAEEMAVEIGAEVAGDLAQAVGAADIVTSATMTTEPLIEGGWLSLGTHLDLIGAYRPDMREADDAAITRGRLFVDSRDTTLGHIGEIQIPVDAGVLRPDNIVADYYDLDAFKRQSADEVTIFKNGGGAHLDLMTARHILESWQAARS